MNENTTDQRTQTITTTTRADVRPGDHVIWESTRKLTDTTLTVRREGTASYQGLDGDWWTATNERITDGEIESSGEMITITIRRTVQEPPTRPGTVLGPADGHEYITATDGGVTYRTREAVLTRGEVWQGAWRSTDGFLPAVLPGQITPNTWKVDEQ